MKKKQATPLSLFALVVVLAAGWFFSNKKAPLSGPAKDVPPPASDSATLSKAERGSSIGTGEVVVGSWNIEWLGNPSERSGAGKAVAQAPEDLAEVIQRTGVTVMVLQEISPTGGTSPPRSREMDRVVKALNAAGKWEYLLFASRSGDQFTGVLWDSARVGIVGSKGETAWKVPVSTRKSSQGSGLWVRQPEAVKFSTGEVKTDFVLVIVHMKADYEGDFSRHREEEAKSLAGLLPDIRKVFADEDVVILGDTNMTGAAEPAERLFEQAGLRDLNSAERATHWRGGATDKIFVPKSQAEFQDSLFSVRNDDVVGKRSMSPSEYKRRYSDHYPVLTTIRVMEDDD